MSDEFLSSKILMQETKPRVRGIPSAVAGAIGIGILNLFTSMVGAPAIPDLSSLLGQPLDAIVEPLDAIVEVLRGVRQAVPLP